MIKLNIKASDGLKIATEIFPAEQSIGVLQIVHGAAEHKERYHDFIRFLNTNGYAAIICDLRGHGASINDKYPLGYMHGVDELLADLYLVTMCAKHHFPGIPIHMLGHSFGSCLARCYLQSHDDALESLILSGTANYQFAVGFGMLMGTAISAIFGGYRSLRYFTDKGKPPDKSWLSYNQENNDKALHDPLCFPYYTNRGQLTIWESDSRLKKYRQYKCQNPGLPILSVSGEDDPITGGARGLRDTKETLHTIGYDNVRMITYPHMKHEVLNEIKRHNVYEDILVFLNAASVK